jgi:hypothetical protein
MLTKEQYEQLWKDWFATPLGGVDMPCYEDYKKFEGMWEDVVDMFKKDKQLIRYILVAEARPFAECGSADAKYVYDDTKDPTPYLRSMHRASYGGLGPGSGTSTSALDMINDLVRRGVLLMDMFPFAVRYSNYRNSLCQYGTIGAAWNGTGPFPFLLNIQDRINLLEGSGLLDSKWDLALCAPFTTTCCILNNNFGLTPIAVPTNIGQHARIFHAKKASLPSKHCCCERKKAAILSNLPVPTSTLITEAFR